MPFGRGPRGGGTLFVDRLTQVRISRSMGPVGSTSTNGPPCPRTVLRGVGIHSGEEARLLLHPLPITNHPLERDSAPDRLRRDATAAWRFPVSRVVTERKPRRLRRCSPIDPAVSTSPATPAPIANCKIRVGIRRLRTAPPPSGNRTIFQLFFRMAPPRPTPHSPDFGHGSRRAGGLSPTGTAPDRPGPSSGR